MAESFRLLGASLVLLLGVTLIITSMFRALGDNWPLIGHERWVLPSAGLGLMALGRWLLP